MSTFRTCDITGFKVDNTTEKLFRLNAVFAVVSLLIAALGAILLVFTRWQDFHVLSSPWYYRIIGLHGVNALVFWIVFFEIAGLYFGSTVVLNSRFCAPKLGWLSFILMATGFILTDVMILSGNADVTMTSYVPLKAHPLYYLGIILFAVGALIGVGLFFGNVALAKKEGKVGKTLPLFTYALMAAAIIAVLTLLSGALVYVPTFLWSLGLVESIDPAWYRLVWWGFGHSAQQINVCAMVGIWYLSVRLVLGGSSINEKVSRVAFLFYILFISIASAHHLLVDPAVSSTWKVWNTSYAMYLAVLASMIHAFAVPSSMEAAQRRLGHNKGLFDWLIKLPWGNPAFSSITLAIIGFGFIGGITGVIYGMEQTNIIVHNTLAIVGHFKGTVVIGTTLTFMGITYYLVPLMFRRKIVAFKLAKIQPWMFFFGIALLAIGMIALGMFGIPRRHYDIAFTGGPFTYDFNLASGFVWVLFGLGGILSFLSMLIWILIIVVSVFFGPRVNGPQDMQLAIAAPLGEETTPHKRKYEAPGTLVLTIIFLVTFLVFYFLNWKWLAAIWEIQ
ncbi:MAG: cytochrome C oxidase subunit I [Bacteroidetes bacterium]|nr:cytochrome C oxidase subunit I [Bacteroidota bacterium]MBV6460388.1 cytochrome c oxidase subunit 1 [Flavobacteriales bacterium]WKZ74756.1 MAG: cbb3-type cytochrome c oxidase subunit I [Vicingaceae bacterium]MCL4815744.1 cbb3-type cytochrome c oxidase subunit I [Flavobacteriales bacterium]NOG95808.1 cytochrome C oxidase subunit I [Bacteroidota bacterium]